MLRYAVIFFVIALIAAVFGFGGIAGAATEIARILFVVFIVLFLVSLIFGGGRGGNAIGRNATGVLIWTTPALPGSFRVCTPHGMATGVPCVISRENALSAAPSRDGSVQFAMRTG